MSSHGKFVPTLMFILLVSLLVYGALSLRVSVAAPQPEMTIHWVRFDTYQEVDAECTARNADYVSRHGKLSAAPSCFHKVSEAECIVIAKTPEPGVDDYAARDFIGKELGNCANGHQFPSTPGGAQ